MGYDLKRGGSAVGVDADHLAHEVGQIIVPPEYHSSIQLLLHRPSVLHVIHVLVRRYACDEECQYCPHRPHVAFVGDLAIPGLGSDMDHCERRSSHHGVEQPLEARVPDSDLVVFVVLHHDLVDCYRPVHEVVAVQIQQRLDDLGHYDLNEPRRVLPLALVADVMQ
ncbi:nucleoside triphosphate pyrophosphohydrolase, putative [Babesia ovata]|uniref:Nucleoside triphosphate pyrophosphohydrolase, putative n=1 Tax=Babesia ovata TaxID=189622 RepID=A0A2H6KFW8_9APIC|nr:nucleoside triphosphate pyrophosphohydrolase, putative [Babesia ovata]GBE61890.1 nucleoside triphosphate pyrophosphohydrolase, putative [Babesia ovata]